MTAPKKREKAKLGKTKSVGYGYVAKWRDGTLGWKVPPHISEQSRQPRLDEADKGILRRGGHDRLIFCKITIEQVFDSKGRAITRKI